ncbi:MAG: aminotransferase class IV [Caulobacteraceae bacterium]|nr:aminotransferase class IV [Caulobacteraceae bacterium]
MSQDRGFLLGDGLFETILAEDGRLAHFEAHAARMARGCGVLGLPAPDAESLRIAAVQALAAAQLARARAAVRLTWTAGSGGRGLDRPEPLVPALFAAAAASPKPSGPASLALTSVRRNPSSPTARLKTLAYLDNVAARREALAAGADEALMLNVAGKVACAAAANVFWILEGRVFTPALDCGVLDGIMRAEVIRRAEGLGIEVVETHAELDALVAAEAVFITNSLIGVRPIRGFGETIYRPHPLVTELSKVEAGRGG